MQQDGGLECCSEKATFNPEGNGVPLEVLEEETHRQTLVWQKTSVAAPIDQTWYECEVGVWTQGAVKNGWQDVVPPWIWEGRGGEGHL